ncbi:ArsR/SmtB family transcription factor [Salinispira pacifica]
MMTETERLTSDARAEVLKAFAHPSRVFIIDKLRSEPHCVCELTEMIGVDTSTVSKHLAILKSAGVVQDRKEGTTVYYSLTCNCVEEILEGVERIVRTRFEKQKRTVAGMPSGAEG